MHPDLIEADVKEILSQTMLLRKDTIMRTDRLIDELCLDSLDFVELSLALEETFSIEVSELEQDSLKTVGDIIKFVEEKTSGKE